MKLDIHSHLLTLNDDGAKEVIVYLLSSKWCGSGGCTALVLAPEGSSYKVITRIMITNPPIRVLATKTIGWHDLAVQVRGGSVQPGYEAQLSFNGKKYPNNPSVLPAKRSRGTATGEVVIPSESKGTPLYR